MDGRILYRCHMVWVTPIPPDSSEAYQNLAIHSVFRNSRDEANVGPLPIR